MQISHEQLLEILDWSDEFEEVTSEILSTKHSNSWVGLIFKDKAGKFWLVNYQQDYYEGIVDLGPYGCTEMEEVQTTTYRIKR